MVEDMDTDAELIQRALARSDLAVDVRRASNRAELQSALRLPWDVVLLDYTLPGLAGEELLTIVRARLPDTPVIFVTGTVGEERAVELLRLGATDYVLKDRLARLAPVISRALAEAADRARSQQLELEVAAAHSRMIQTLDRMPSPFMAIDRAQRVTFANRAVEPYLNVSASSTVGRSLWELLAPGAESTAPFEAIVENTVVTGDPFAIEAFMPGWDRWFEAHGHAIDDGLAIFVRDVTERKQAEVGLRRRDAMLSAIASAAELIVRGSAEQEIDAALERLGTAAEVSRAAFIDGRIEKVRHEWHASDLPPLAEVAQALPAEWAGRARWMGALGRGDTLVGDADSMPGEEAARMRALGISSFACAPVFLEREWVGYLALAETERRRTWSEAELDALRAAARVLGAALERDRAVGQLRTVVENIPMLLWAVDAEGIFRTCVGAALAELGVDSAAVVGRPASALVPEAFRRLWPLRESAPDPITAVVPVGNLHLEVRARRMLDGDGRFAGMIGTATNVTERLAAEAERARLIWAMEQTDSAVTIADADDRVTYVNAAFERLFGTERSAVVGQPAAILDSGQHPPGFYTDINERIERGETWSGTIVSRRADGTQIEVESVMSPMRNETGRIIGRVEVARDITRERALEAQLRHAQKMEAVGRLAGGIAHDFNNILTAIDGFAQLALDDLPPGAVRSDVEEIRRNAERAAALTHQLLAFSRRQVLRPAIVEPSDVVEALIPMLRRILGEDVELTWEPDPSRGRVVVDPSQLEQVLVNLAVNARDAMPTGGRLEISIRSIAVDEAYAAQHPGATPGAYVVLVVADTGIGMDPETKAHLFEPFYTTKPLGVGTGLGLATVHGIVHQSGGYISFESTQGGGTTFSVYLPRVEAGDADAPVAERQSGRQPLPALKVMLVEDEEAVRAFATRVLERSGVQVIAAGAPADALAAAHGAPVDLLISDVVMPGMTGPELADALRPLHPGMAVLYMSGYVEQSLTKRGLERSGDGFLSKPFSADDLLAAVHDALAVERSDGDGRANHGRRFRPEEAPG